MNMFQEALLCLQLIEKECKKSSNLDLKRIIENCKKCSGLVKKLKSTNKEPLRQAALCEIEQTLLHHEEVFETKLDQIGSQSSQSSNEKSSDHKNELPDTKNNQRKSAIEDTILSEGTITFNDVAGLEEAKQTLKEAIIIPLLFPHLFTGGRKPWKRILLYGPPGTGKSRLAQAVASEIQSTFYCVSSSDLVSSWVGESEKLIKELFQHAMSQDGRSVIFIDEIDSICRKRSSSEEEYTRRIKTELLKQMEGANTDTASDKIFLLCATNCPWEIDSAFLRRFQKRIYIPLPDSDARQSLLRIHTKDNPIEMSESDWEMLCNHTQGYSGSDIATMVLGALFEPIRHMQSAQYWKNTEDGHVIVCDKNETGAFKAAMTDLPADKIIPKEVTLEDFLKALQKNRNTVTQQELSRFEYFTQDYGVNG